MDRLDEMIVRKHGLSRVQAQRLIRAGNVFVDGEQAVKPAAKARPGALITIAERPRYVSRAGEKLAHALSTFGIAPRGARALDVGISTGGFSDVLLEAGVASIVGVDVGHGVTHPRIADHERVTLCEGVNARALPLGIESHVGDGFDLIVIDVSFISLRLILPAVRPLLRGDSPFGCVVLIKPQFEVGRDGLDSDGVVRDEAIARQAIEALTATFPSLGFSLLAMTTSPVIGLHGNTEMLAHLRAIEMGKA